MYVLLVLVTINVPAYSGAHCVVCLRGLINMAFPVDGEKLRSRYNAQWEEDQFVGNLRVRTIFIE